MPQIITLDEIVSQISVEGFQAHVKSKPSPVQLSSSKVECLQASPGPPSHGAAVTVLLRVTGMHCGSCVTNIQDKASSLPGVVSVAVSLEQENAAVCYNPRLISVAQIRQAVEALPPGNFRVYMDGEIPPVSQGLSTPLPLDPEPGVLQPQGPVVVIGIEGMTCGSCVHSIEGMMSQHKGVKSVQVSLSSHKGTFEYDPLITTAEELRLAIEDMGFDAFLPGKFNIIGKLLWLCNSILMHSHSIIFYSKKQIPWSWSCLCPQKIPPRTRVTKILGEFRESKEGGKACQSATYTLEG